MTRKLIVASFYTITIKKNDVTAKKKYYYLMYVFSNNFILSQLICISNTKVLLLYEVSGLCGD